MVMLVINIPKWWFVVAGVPLIISLLFTIFLTYIGVACVPCVVATAICREILVSALREWMAERAMRSAVKVGYLGKLKTAAQMTSIVTLLFTTVGAPPGAGGLVSLGQTLCTMDTLDSCSPHFTAGVFLFIASVVLSILSAGQYLSAAWPALTAVDGDSFSNIAVVNKTMS
jgi:phosphatidylglycerophosphate synthase